ncbi:MAG: hypothetical protein ACRD63_10955, partial [Pyrinomonadaceae bacterium]
MSIPSPFTEEGRTRLRNYQRRLLSYAVAWLLIGIVVMLVVYRPYTRTVFSPLERIYFRQYVKAAVLGLILPHRTSKFKVLALTVKEATEDTKRNREMTVAATDEQVEPVLNGSGRIMLDEKKNPLFSLRSGSKVKRFFWSEFKQRNGTMYGWWRESFFQDKSPLLLLWPLFAIGAATLLIGFGVTVTIDFAANRKYEEGTAVRGTK